jgi:CheY-like chemotaxis protein
MDARPAILLLVEDDPDVSDALGTVLSDEGYRVLVAANGREALEQLRAGARPELILCDLMMPIMDGYAFRDAQRADPAVADIPVLVLTASVLDARAGRLAAAATLQKPVDLELLFELVARALARRSAPGA